MSNTSIRHAVEWDVESAWAENVQTFTKRAPVLGVIDTSTLKRDALEPQRTTQYGQEVTQWIDGIFTGSTIKTRIWLAGHGSTMVGSPTQTSPELLLAYVFGTAASNGILSAAASTTLTGGTVTVPTTTASGTFSPGGLCRIGSKGDGKADGQMYPIATHVTTSLTPLIALAGTPANGDVLYPVWDYFLPEDLSAAAAQVTGLRFKTRGANLSYECHGCFPMTAEIGGLNTGDCPYIEVTWGVSWWETSATSGISAVANTAFNPSPVTVGSFAINTVGTATRATRSIRDFKLTISLGIARLEGPGGVKVGQTVIGAKRLPTDIEITWTEDADAATATPVLDGYFTSKAFRHLMYTLSTTDGSAIGLYFPNLVFAKTRPVQVASNDNVNRIAIIAKAGTGPTNTSELTLSAMRLGLA